MSSTTPRVSTVATFQGERARYNTFRAILPSSSGPVLAEAHPAVDGDQHEDEASDIPLSVLHRNPSRYKTGKSSIKYWNFKYFTQASFKLSEINFYLKAIKSKVLQTVYHLKLRKVPIQVKDFLC